MGRREKKQGKKSNGVKILVIILVILVIIAGILLALKLTKKGQTEQVNNGEVQEEKRNNQN